MPLNDKEIKTLRVKKEGQKAQKFPDINGLYLYVTLARVYKLYFKHFFTKLLPSVMR
jgi:hypothetical protein